MFSRQRGVKMGHFYRLRVKNSNHLHTALSLGYWKNAKFYLESKASFIDISSIASFKLFLIAWLREYRTFSDISVVSLKSSLGQNTRSWELFSEKKLCSTIKLFSFSNVFFIRLFLANFWKKIGGSPCSFKRKGEFISPSSLVWRKSLTFRTCMCSCARTNGAKIVRSRDAQCNSKELP